VAALSVLLVLGLAVRADDRFPLPAQHIVGADEPIGQGEVAALTPSPIKDPPRTLVSSSYSWKLLEGTKERPFFEYKDGILFGAGVKARRLTAICAVTHLYMVRERPDDPASRVVEVATRTNLLIAEVVIGEPPTPPPGPEPPPGPAPPTPEPSLPDGQFALAKFAFQEAGKVAAADRAKGAAALADSLAGVASAIAAGTLNDPQEILTKTREANDAALSRAGVTAGSWSAFGAALQAELVRLYKDGKLKTKDHYRAAWLELATGLRAIK
jgi:hypothetical protein